jgi:ribosomal protein S27E
MSKSESTTITCPGCNHEQQFTIWQSVNVTLDPTLKQKVLDRSLTTFECESCGHTTTIEQNLLYHDMARQLMILRRPTQDEPEELASESFGLLGTLSGKGYDYRLVTSMNELVEKILIWEDGLDDRTVEVFKLVVWQALEEDRRTGEAQLFYGGMSGEAGPEATMEFTLVSDAGTMSMAVPLEGEFRRLEKQIVQGLPDVATEQGKWLRVDRAYAQAILGDQE